MKNVIVVLMLLLAIGVSAQDDMMGGPDVVVTLEATPFAEGAGLVDITGWAHVVSDDGHVHIALEGDIMVDGVLEGWVVDTDSASDDDEVYGVAFGNEEFDSAVESAPYALSTGVLTQTDDGLWEVIFDIPNYNFSPYDLVVVTLESDGNSDMGFDPRPGTPVFAGAIADGEPADDMMMGEDMADEDDMMDDDDDMMDDSEDMSDDDMMMDDMMGAEITLETTPFAEGAGLADITATSIVYVEDGSIDITINLNGATLPEGTVLEGWVVDTDSASDDDEAYGVAFGDEMADAAVESAPYALSTGVLYDNMDGTLTLSFHVPAYNFSPYDAVVVTLESDGNSYMGFDPRPGTPVLAGEIAHDGM